MNVDVTEGKPVTLFHIEYLSMYHSDLLAVDGGSKVDESSWQRYPFPRSTADAAGRLARRMASAEGRVYRVTEETVSRRTVEVIDAPDYPRVKTIYSTNQANSDILDSSHNSDM